MNRTSDLPAEKTDLANPDLGPQVWIIQAQGLDWDPNPDLANPDLGPANPDLSKIQTLRIQTSDLQIRTSDLGLEKTDPGLDFFLSENPIRTWP